MKQGSIISARRAKAELKQFVKGTRADGFGKYTARIFAVNCVGKFKELNKPEDVDKFNDGVMKFLLS